MPTVNPRTPRALPESKDAAPMVDATPVFQEAPAIGRSEGRGCICTQRLARTAKPACGGIAPIPRRWMMIPRTPTPCLAAIMPDAAQDLYRQVGAGQRSGNNYRPADRSGDEPSEGEISELITRQPSDFLRAAGPRSRQAATLAAGSGGILRSCSCSRPTPGMPTTRRQPRTSGSTRAGTRLQCWGPASPGWT